MLFLTLRFSPLQFDAYCLCWETSSIYIIQLLSSFHASTCLTSSTSCFKTQTNFASLFFSSLTKAKPRKKTIFLQVFSFASTSLFECREGARQAWINLIRCALLSNSSYTQTESEQKPRRRASMAGIMHGGVRAINSKHSSTAHTTHTKIGKLDSFPVQWFWYYIADKPILQPSPGVRVFDWLFALKALTCHESSVGCAKCDCMSTRMLKWLHGAINTVYLNLFQQWR